MKHYKTRFYFGIPFFLCLIFSFSCRKLQIKYQGCKGNMAVMSGTYTSDSVTFYAPNAFTPNGDMLNDEFGIVTIGIDKVILRIYEGSNLIFTSSGENPYWDGMYNNRIKQGNYSYEADLYSIHDEIIKIKGELSLILPETLSKKPIEHCESCKFKDMIDPTYGFVYESQEIICFY